MLGQGPRCPFAQCLRDKLMSVKVGALEGNKKFPGPYLPRIAAHPLDPATRVSKEDFSSGRPGNLAGREINDLLPS